MADITNNAEGGSNGTTVTTGNSGGTSGTAWDAVTIGSGSTLTFDNSQAAHGNLAYKFVNGAAVTSRVGWTTAMGTQSTIYGRIYIYITANPSNNVDIFLPELAGSIQARVRLLTTGAISIINGSGSTVATTTNSVNTNAWFRIEFTFTFNAASSSASLKLFNTMDSAAPTETISTGTTSMGSLANADQFFLGITQGAANSQTLWMDDLDLNNTGFPGPAGSGPAVSDSVTTSESVGYYTDLVATRESYSVVIQVGNDLSVSVNDTVNTAENVPKLRRDITFRVIDNQPITENVPTPGISYQPTVSDTAGTIENTVLLIPTLLVTVNDAVGTTENTNLLNVEFITTSDSTGTTERVDVVRNNARDINVSDTQGTSENVVVSIPGVGADLVSVSDSETLMENTIVVPIVSITRNDTVGTVENVQLSIQENDTVNDTVGTAESTKVEINGFINKSETVNTIESINQSVLVSINKSETVATIESLVLSMVVRVQVSDLTITSENMVTSIQQAARQISRSDIINTSELLALSIVTPLPNATEPAIIEADLVTTNLDQNPGIINTADDSSIIDLTIEPLIDNELNDDNNVYLS